MLGTTFECQMSLPGSLSLSCACSLHLQGSVDTRLREQQLEIASAMMLQLERLRTLEVEIIEAFLGAESPPVEPATAARHEPDTARLQVGFAHFMTPSSPPL